MPVFRQDGRAVLFVHVPKAGGSTLERLFAKSGWTTGYRDPKGGVGSMNSVRRCSPQHMHRPMLEQVFRLDRFDAVFMTVREPLGRFRSEFAYRNADRVSATAAEVEAWYDEAFRQYRHDPFVFDNHLRPQWEFHLPGSHVYRLEDGLEAVVHDLNTRWGLGLLPLSRGAAGARPQGAERHREQRGTAHARVSRGGCGWSTPRTSRASDTDPRRLDSTARTTLATRRPGCSPSPLLPVLSGACV